MKTALFSRTYWKSKEFKSTDKARAAEKSAALVFNFGGAPMKRKKLWKVFCYKGKESILLYYARAGWRRGEIHTALACV